MAQAPKSMQGKYPSLSTFTDLYELTMAEAYWRSGRTAEATFSLTFRGYPANRAYYVLAGLKDVLDYLEGFGPTEADLDRLRGLGIFGPDFLDHLGGLRFEGQVRAIPEGTICFAEEPVIEVTAPVIQAQIAETYILNQVNLQTALATKASRAVHAAGGGMVVDFGARRIHGTEAADSFARVSHMVGFAGTSNVRAGLAYGIPVYGTMAHSFVTSFEREIDSFRAYAETFPASTTLLVDTYSTLEGVKNAIRVGLEMKSRGHHLRAIRLDSGDLLELSRAARRMLDEAGLEDVHVFASGGLDEFSVWELLCAGAPIDGFGVGTKVGVSADAPYTDCAYKMVEYDGRPVLKLSTDKRSLPGPKQVYRRRDSEGNYVGDVVASAHEAPPAPGYEPLLKEVVRGGRRLGPDPTLRELREQFAREFGCLPDRHKALRSPEPYPVTHSELLDRLTAQVVRQVQIREGLQ